MRRTAFAMLAVCLLGAALAAQDTKWLPDYAGTAVLTPPTKYAGEWGLSPADANAYYQDMRRLFDVLLSQPQIKTPRGVRLKGLIHPRTFGDFTIPPGPKAPIASFGFVQFFPIFERDGKVLTPNEIDIEMVFTVNDPEHIADPLGAGEYRDEEGRRIYIEPKKVGDIQGFPLYERRHGPVYDMLVLTRTTKPLWKPVSQEQFIRGELRRMQREQARMGHSKPSPVMIGYNAALEAMSPAERQAPARFQTSAKAVLPNLAPAGSTKGEALVISNPDWYDPSVPRWATQLIVVSSSYGGFDRFDPTHPQWDGKISLGPVRLYQAMRGIDWKAINALIR
jgi:hypothetical protein